jgi:hypothetical protein
MGVSGAVRQTLRYRSRNYPNYGKYCLLIKHNNFYSGKGNHNAKNTTKLAEKANNN